MIRFQYDVSLIVPIYNAEEYISNCLESIAAQTFDRERMEVILVDDGSTDHSGSICRNFVEKYDFFRVYGKENGGVSSARNLGMECAEGKYLIFLDADDRINPVYVESIVRFFQENEEEIDMVTSHELFYEEGLRQQEHIRYQYLTDTGIYSLNQFPYILQNGTNVCVKNTKLRFDTDRTYQENQKFCTEILKEKMQIGYVKEAEYYHEMHESGLMGRNESPIQYFESSTSLFEEMFQKYESDVPQYIQALFIHDFVWKFRANRFWPYHYGEKEMEKARKRVQALFKRVDDQLIMNYPGAQSFERLYCLRLKGTDTAVFASRDGVKLFAGGKVIYRRNNMEIVLRRIRVSGGRVYVRGFIKSPVFSYGMIPEFYLSVNGRKKKVDCTDCGAGYYKSKEKTNSFYGFEVSEHLSSNLSMVFSVLCDGFPIPVTFYNTPSVVFSETVHEYYTEGILAREEAGQLSFTQVQEEEKSAFIEREIEKLTDDGIKKVVRRVFTDSRERIWLYMDAPTVAEDNGMIQFMHDREIDDGVCRYYIVTNLEAAIPESKKDQLVSFGSERHIELFLKAEKVLASFVDDAVLWPVAEGRKQLQGLFGAEIVYLQHGVLYAHLPWYYSKYVSMIDKIVISSGFERNNLTANYDYEDNDLLQSGMPRFDLLKRKTLHTGKILYAPSWRSYLVKQKSGDRSNDPGRPTDRLMQSSYYKGIMGLINDKKLNLFLQREGIILELKLHPEFYALYENMNMPGNKNIQIAGNGVDLNQYDLLVTDFSSLLFDFVYMNKPVVCFLPDKNEFNCGLNHYRQLDMPLADGMGEYADSVEDAVEYLIALAKNKFEVQEKFQRKYLDFYAGLDDRCREKLYGMLNPEGGRVGEKWFETDTKRSKEVHIAVSAVTDEDGSFKEFKRWFAGYDREHVWMFDAGHNGRRDFRGNPKYLFVYINRYRPDIRGYWYCEADAQATIDQVKALGFIGVTEGSKEADYAVERTGVVVSEQLREYLPEKLLNTKYLNLWHGIGFKRIERARIEDGDDLRIGISRKYINYNSYMQNNQLLVVNSPVYEQEFMKDFGLDKSHLLRTGYLRCMYQQKYEPVCTFEHNLLAVKGLPDDTIIAVYAPTFRPKRGGAFQSGMRDLEKLYELCERKHVLLIFKVHPHIEKEMGFLNAWGQYGGRKYFWFWDNANDFYEIMDKVDLVIYDYSSIFSDFLCAGVKHFIRYIYDEDEYMLDGITQGKEAYYDRTCGTVCRSFDELLYAVEHYNEISDSTEIERIYQKMWSYAGENDFEKTIEAVMNFKVTKRELPALYSFDVFDTLISRKGLHPYSIFYAVREKMKKEQGFPEDFTARYPEIRHSAEMNVREYYRKTTDIRQSDKVEITMQEIFRRIADVYGITDRQADCLMEWEIEEEIRSVVPLTAQIDLVKYHLQKGDNVVLISDMYLPKNVIMQMLKKADPVLEELPLFLSNEYGVLKSSGLLYFEVYRSFKPFYSFGKWIHCGDNLKADQTAARKLGIQTRLVSKPEFSVMEDSMVKKLNNYDAYLVAAMQARLREESGFSVSEFVIDFVSMTMLPYVDWVIRDALSRGFKTLYFISRDGYPLKLIADALIETHKWEIKTKYLYASRRTWRIPSYFDKIDDIFWVPQGGNFNDITSKEELFKAMAVDEDNFRRLLPHIDLDGINWDEDQQGRKLAPIIRNSEAYQEYVLRKAKEERRLVCGYLKQEIDASEKFACVEYWGRGYNQECMSRLWNYVVEKEEDCHYYYARSIYLTEGKCIRYNFTVRDTSLIFVEAIFANMPYGSIEQYEERDGKIEAVMVPVSYDRNLFDAMRTLLPRMAKQYAMLNLADPIGTDRKLYDFLLEYYEENKASKLIAENMGGLKYSQSMYGERIEFAKEYGLSDLDSFKNGIPRGKGTNSITMSYARAADEFKVKYNEMYQCEQEDEPAEGVLLNSGEIDLNNRFRKKYETLSKRARKAADEYTRACGIQKVCRKVCVVSMSRNFENDTLYVLRKQLLSQEQIYVEWISAVRDEAEDVQMMNQLAMAQYIIVEGNVTQLLGVSFRAETTVIGLLDRGFRLYHYGHGFRHKLKWRVRYEEFLYSLRASAVECGNLSYAGTTFRAYNLDAEAVDKLEGCCVTDVLFDEVFRAEAYEEIHGIFPETIDKKLVVYVPLPRKRRKSNEWLELLDIERLQELIGDKYVVALDFRGNHKLVEQCGNLVEIPGFSKDVSKMGISRRSLLVAADVIVGDYRDIFFESALLSKPVYATAADYGYIQEVAVNMAYDLQNVYPFPIVGDSDELAEKLGCLEQYDFEPLKVFCRKYLAGCDGHAAERLLKYII